jgi:hypothetical protein
MSLISETKQALEKQAREEGLIDAPAGNGSKAQLKLPGDNREYSVFAREAGEILATKGLFRRDLVPVTINDEKKRLDPMSGQHFRTWAERHIGFFKERTVQDLLYRIPKTMNLDVALAVLESRTFLSQLPEIRRLNAARQPVYREDGRIELLSPGFFEEQGIYTLDDGLTYDLEMTGARGAEIMRDLFKEYPLDARSLAAQIGAMLTMFCACMVNDGTRPPCFIYTANAPRAGKTMLAKFPVISVVGSAATRTLPRYEEARKVLDIIVLQGDSYAIFDNIRGKIQGEEIEAFLAGPLWEVRPLGQSRQYRIENNAIVFFTGNQLDKSQDMSDRALIIELLVEEADSRDRKFSRIINDAFIAARARRSEICSALWAMVRDWDAAGRLPKEPKLMGGFETWSKVVPPIVLHAGFGDCLLKAHIKGSPDELDDMFVLVRALAPVEPETESKSEFDDLMTKVKELGLFENEEVRGGRRDADLFDKDGKVTRSGRSLFGKLFIRYDRRKFLIDSRSLVFLVIGRGDSRRYHVALT